MSFLNAEEPTACDLIADFGIKLLWHPSLGLELGENLQNLMWNCVLGNTPLDILVFEGSVINAPNGTGEWNRFADRPMKDWLWDLSKVANFVVAVGDCATWGGIPAMSPNPSQSTGLQFLKREEGGFLGKDFRAKSGLPVINIPGCPSHPDWITQILVAIATGRIGDIALDELHRPQTFFKTFTQTGCTRNIHFAYKATTGDFGQRKGCLFYDLGCRGPMTHSSCNRILWNRVSSKTRAGMPCIGCTEPEFPFYDLKPGTVFKTHVRCTLWYSRWIANIIDFLSSVIENIVKSRRVLSIALRNSPYDYRAPKLARTRKPHGLSNRYCQWSHQRESPVTFVWSVRI